MNISLWCWCFLSISGFDSGSGAHFHSESVQRYIYCNIIEHLHSWKECVRVNSVLWHNSLNWSYLHDADDFFHFRVLIRVQELIFIRNQSRDSFILIKLNTLHSWKEFVRVNSNFWYNSIYWSYLYDADVFIQFRVMNRVQELISIRNQSRDSFILIKLNTYTLEKSVWESFRFCGIIRLIGHISMMQMISFISVLSFGFRSLFSFGISPEIHLF